MIAATAGRDTWQTWAGRNDGTESFEYLDVFRGIKRSISHSLQSKVPKKGTPCPICFCEPDANESPSSFWHVTWCGHAICKDCLGQYAKSQVEDREQMGPLKCPVCLKILRKQDAVVAMMAGKQNDSSGDLIKQWDDKIRDQLLRAIPSFRSCPKCGGSGIGGGFVTPECLGPQHQERRDQAIQILLTRNYTYVALVFAYMILIGTIAKTKSPSAYLDLFSMLMPIYVFAKAGMAVNFLLARRAREALFRSISVECPCCDETFVLPAESKQFADEETSRWVQTNTRPCPSCSVPISKAGGCNHVRCSNCGANFCWACMRLRTACQAYRCQNGAPYRNASLLDVDSQPVPRLQALRSDGSVLTYIDYILNNRVCPELRFGDGLLLMACLIARHSQITQFLLREILSPFFAFLLQTSESIFYILSLIQFVFLFLGMPTQYWNASLGRIFPRLFEPMEGGARRFGIDRQRLEYISRSLTMISFISHWSLPVGVGIGVAYFGNLIITTLQRQGQQQLQEGEGGAPIPENTNQLQIDELNQNLLNEALRRSIEET